MTAELVVAALVVLVVLIAVAALAAGYGDVLAPTWRDAAPLPLPAGRPMTAADVAATRFGVAVRGYRMAEVDLVLDRLGRELAERDEELAQLRELVADRAGSSDAAAGDPGASRSSGG